MKAAVYYENGPPGVLKYEDVEDPVLLPQGIIIRVEAVSIEGGDTLNRLGGALVTKPHIVGYQAAGTIIDDRLTIACGKGAIRALKVQREGKGVMDSETLLRGFKLNTSPIYLEFLRGERDLKCAAWANPTPCGPHWNTCNSAGTFALRSAR